MKYFISARKSMSTFALSSRTCEIIKWGGIGVYALIIVTLWLVDIISYPGTSDIYKFVTWYQETASNVLKTTYWVWIILNLINTSVTLLSIFLLFKKINML